jgi:OOP family OmpA-OmpF porin
MRALASVVILVGLAIPSDPARAQTPANVPLDEFSSLRFAPAPGPGNYLMVEGALVAGHLVPSVGLTLDYAHHPFTLFNATCAPEDAENCDVTTVNVHLVEFTFAGHLQFALGLFERVQLGLSVPLAYTSGDSFSFTRMETGEFIAVQGGETFGVGDPRLSVKVRIAGRGTEGPTVSATVYGTAPIGQITAESRYLGDDTPIVGGHVIGEFIAQGFHVSGNVGGFFRPAQTLFSTEVGSMLTYGVGIGYDVTPLIMILGEVEGASSLGLSLDENPLEARIAARLTQGDFAFTLGGGMGIVSGVGVPLFRAVGAVAWAPIRTDQDGDGLTDTEDECPSEVEDIDGYFDTDGCPEADNDDDGLLDANDPCPDAGEDRDEFEDDDGCPDPDNDGDFVNDGYDSCPAAREDMDGDRDEDGCPDNDRDRDGVEDEQDACADAPEDTDGFGDLDGCPELDFDSDGVPDDGDECPDLPEILNRINDTDGCPEEDADQDGIVDDRDRCPDRAETLNGRSDDDGCPDGDALVEVQGTEIRLLQQVQFATSSARIRGRQSQQILDAVEFILSRNPQYRRVRVEGHTDNAGNAEANMRLSQERAQACVDYLVRRGVAADRLYAQGFGQERPLGSNDTPEGREQNRRVEFHMEAPPPEAPPPPPADETFSPEEAAGE